MISHWVDCWLFILIQLTLQMNVAAQYVVTVNSTFFLSYGIAVGSDDNVYASDYNGKIYKISADGALTTFVQSYLFSSLGGLAIDSSENIYVADTDNHIIRRISPSGTLSVFAGSGQKGSNNGYGTLASFKYPIGVTVDNSGYVYVADRDNHMIRRISSAGYVSTFAGNGQSGNQDGPAASASFYYPSGVAVDSSGNVYVSDKNNHKIRQISPLRVVSTFAGSGQSGSLDGPAASATFNFPIGVAVDSVGYVYVSDSANHIIRKISPLRVVSTFAGSGQSGSLDGPATSASFDNPIGVAVDSDRNVYVSNKYLRKIVLCPMATKYATDACNTNTADGSLGEPWVLLIVIGIGAFVVLATAATVHLRKHKEKTEKEIELSESPQSHPSATMDFLEEQEIFDEPVTR